MAIDPGTIHLTPEQQRRLAELAERAGRPWSEVLDEALRRARWSNGNTHAAEGSRSFFDVLAQDGAIGVVKEDLPTDVATNPKHMEGFGLDRRNGPR
jgi:hypothetical protein